MSGVDGVRPRAVPSGPEPTSGKPAPCNQSPKRSILEVFETVGVTGVIIAHRGALQRKDFA
jgi:uncharacterized Zn-binding protein involved in type VI secretion